MVATKKRAPEKRTTPDRGTTSKRVTQIAKREGDPPTHKEDPILSLSEVARQVGKHNSTVFRWVRDGLLETVSMPSGLKGVRKSVVNKFLGGSALNRQIS